MPKSPTMTPPYHTVLAGRPFVIQVALLTGLLLFTSQVSVTQAQLTPCTPLQQEQGVTWCESPRESSKSLFETLKRWFGVSGEPAGEARFTGLDPLPKPTFKNDPYELDPIVKPSQLPINSAREYLNRQDTAHAIYPIEPGTRHLFSTP